MRILLIGSTGQMGTHLSRVRPASVELLTPPRHELDVVDGHRVLEYLRDKRPDVVVNTAAFHDLVLCETEAEQAFRTNSLAVRSLARGAARIGARLVTFSTNYVFDGEKRGPYAENDCTRPVQAYGITRLAGELFALSELPRKSLIIRTSALYGFGSSRERGANFVDRRIEDARAGKKVEIACEQVVSSSYAEDLAKAIYALLLDGYPSGIYHLVNEGTASWYELAVTACELAGYESVFTPIDRQGFSGGIKRPINGALANTKAPGLALPHWKDALKRYVDEKYGQGGA